MKRPQFSAFLRRHALQQKTDVPLHATFGIGPHLISGYLIPREVLNTEFQQDIEAEGNAEETLRLIRLTEGDSTDEPAEKIPYSIAIESQDFLSDHDDPICLRNARVISPGVDIPSIPMILIRLTAVDFWFAGVSPEE